MGRPVPHLAAPGWGRLLPKGVWGCAPRALPASCSSCPSRQRAPRSTLPCPGGGAMGKDSGAESCCFGERLLSRSPVSDHQALPVVPKRGGWWGPGPGRLAPAAGSEGVRGQDGCLAYESHLLEPGRGGGIGGERLQRAFPLLTPSAKGLSPHALPGCLCVCVVPPVSCHIISSRWHCRVWGEAGLWALRAGSLAPHPPCLHPGLLPARAQLRGQGRSRSTDRGAWRRPARGL